jgi:hypothetical protein
MEDPHMLLPRHGVSLAALLLVLGFPLGAGGASAADDPCAGFGWNVARERALFAAAPQGMKAGAQLATAPAAKLDQLYDLALTSQDQVHFPAPPGKKPKSGAFAGLVRLRVPTAGVYRVSVDQPFWIDVVSGHELIRSDDFQGAPGCNGPHKIVQFTLPAGQELVLQVSGTASPHTRITVTPAPPTAH